jgi:hypothetical protein
MRDCVGGAWGDSNLRTSRREEIGLLDPPELESMVNAMRVVVT